MKYGILALTLTLLLSGGASAKTAKCLLAVEGEVYINGACEFEQQGGGDFQIWSADRTWTAMVALDPDGTGERETAVGVWNSDGVGPRYVPATRLHGGLGTLKRDGACWLNRDAILCAW